MKLKAILVMSLLMVSALAVCPSTQAAPLTGTIVLMDGSDRVQNYFEPADTIHFDVTVLDAGGPLQYDVVTVVIYGYAGIGEVFNYTYSTNNYGQFSGWSSDDYWWSHEIGDYIMYVNYTDTNVVSETFEIYDPVPWSATGFTSYYGDATDTFTEGQRVDVNVLVLDQLGNPFDGGYGDVWYEISHNSAIVDTSYLSTNSAGTGSDYYYPSGTNQFGQYLVTIYNNAVPEDIIGYTHFTVTLPSRAIVQPQYYGNNRTIFTAGESVGYQISLFYNGSTTYQSTNYAARVLLYKTGVPNPIVNISLSTNSVGEDYENNLYDIGYAQSDKGTYRIMVYNHTWNLIGTGIFMVIDMDIAITPFKNVYAQGDEVVLSVTTSLQEAYRVAIANSTHTVLTGATWNVPAGSTEWMREFAFPEIADGTYFVDVYMDTLLIDSLSFELKKFTIEVRLSQNAFLPGQTGTLFWMAVNNHDGGPISITANTEMNYVDSAYAPQTDVLDNLNGASGSFDFFVPRTAEVGSNAHIDIDAKDVIGHADDASANFNVGELEISATSDRTTYRPGESVYLTFSSFVEGTNSIVPDVMIKCQAQRDGVTVGNIWTVTTDGSGTVDYIYSIPSSAAEGLYVIIINATFDVNRNLKHNSTSTFAVSNDPVISLVLYQEMNLYTPGSTVTVPYRVLRDGVDTTGAQVSYEARLGGSWSSASTIALGFGSSGSLTINLPADKEGRLFIQSTALTTDGYTAYAQLYNIEVSSGQVALFTIKSVYLPGENITWIYVLTGDTELSAHYRILDPSGVVLAEGTPMNGTFTYRVPDQYARAPTATVYITGAQGTYIEADTAVIYDGYMIKFTLLKNSYAPGDIMKVNYTITKIGQGPETTDGFMVQLTFLGEYVDTIWVTEMFGIIEYQLPEELRDGRHLVTIAIAGEPDTFNDIQTIIIDSDAGELAHGTIAGMNAGAFIVMLLAIVALIIALVGIVKWRKFAKAGKTETPQPPTPPVENYQQPIPVEQQPPVPEQSYYPPPPPSD
jgi:hypothetical protein